MHIHIPVAFQAFLHLLLLSFHSSATRLPLLHRDHKLSSPHDDYGRLEARMKRDVMRVASLTRRLAGNESSSFETNLQYDTKEYWAEVGVGTPPQKQSVLIDTGSDFSWVKCRCDPCTFDPTKSTSFVEVLCNDTNCYKVKSANWGCVNLDLPCTYVLNYLDGGPAIQGTMAMESITVGNTTVQNVPVGCSYVSGGVFNFGGADGLLGLGGGSASFARQSGVFSYCLGHSATAGWLGFGYENVPRDAKWASLVSNPNQPSSYYLDLVEISVGGEVLDIPADTLQVNPDTGEGGMLLDTGTSVTRLAQGAYEALRDKFKEKISNDFAAGGRVSILDTCYNIEGFDPESVPAVLFNISSRGMDPATITLKANIVLLQMKESTYCLAFAGIDQNLIILGNLQQGGTQITIDATRGYVGFGPETC